MEGVIAVGKKSAQLDDLIRLLRTLPEEEIAAVRAFVERLVQRQAAVKETPASYVVPVTMLEELAHPGEHKCLTVSGPMTCDEALNLLASDLPGFLPGELDDLLADIEQSREMELEDPWQPT
jgi:hypothetical protein